MSDTTKPPAQPPIKDAVPDGKGDAPPVAKPLTLSQQIFIWTMVAIVGVIFGVGASFSLVFAPTQRIAGIAEGEVLQRMQVAERMERVLNPNAHPYNRIWTPGPWVDNPLESYATDLRLARIGEARGLLPKGQALERIEQEFLATPMPGASGRTYLDALREHTGGNDEVRRDDLRRTLGELAARRSLFARSAIAPAVPRAIAPDVAGLRSDRAELAEVVLSGARFVPEVKPDDPEIPAAYERLRGSRFTKPGGVSVAIAWADRDELGKALEISDADAEAWYGTHKDLFPGEPDAKDPGKKPEAKPFAEVKDQVIAKLRAERGSSAAQKALDALNRNADVLEGEKDPARFRAAVAEAKLKLAEITAEDRTPGTVDLGALGTIKDVMRLFGREHEVGFLSEPQITSAGHWVMIRLEKRTDPGFQELDSVRAEVARHLAGRRAWKPLMEAAAKLRDELAGKGPGALAVWAASEEAKPWNVSLVNKPQPLTSQLAVPPAEADGVPGEPQLLAALALSARPPALVAAEPAWEGEVPRVRLVQVGEIKPGPRDGLAETQFAGQYRSALARYSQMLFSRELQAQLGDR
jgi:hypothetical protein